MYPSESPNPSAPGGLISTRAAGEPFLQARFVASCEAVAKPAPPVSGTPQSRLEVIGFAAANRLCTAGRRQARHYKLYKGTLNHWPMLPS